MTQQLDISDLLVVVPHPHTEQDLEIPLTVWMEEGPGPRELLRPIAVKQASTGGRLPLRVIPLRYRNSSWSRLFIKIGLIHNPWEIH